MRFYSIKKKPKVYSLIGVFAVAAAALAVQLNTSAVSQPVMAVILILCPIACLVILSAAFMRQLRYNPYSYNTIYYAAFSLLALFSLISEVVVFVRVVRCATVTDVLTSNLVGSLSASARNYMLFTSPFILVFSAALCISNISLIRHEGRRPVNFLGILLSVLMIGGEVYLFIASYYYTGSELEVMIKEILTNLFACVYLYFECMIIGTIIANIIVTRYEPSKDKDFIIILGCGLRKDGTPTPLLKGRADRALKFYRRQIEECGKAPVFVASGGQGPDEVISEGESIRNYLLEHGVPAEHILTENKSTDTYENMFFSKEIIDSVNPEAKVAFSTTNYHVFRSGIKANRVKMHPEGMGAKTKWYFWPNASVRELAGILTEHRGKQILIFAGMAVFYVIMTVLNYKA